MTKLALWGLFMSVFFCVKAQTDTAKVGVGKRNELKLNLLNSVLGFPEITYERILTNEASVGLSLAVSLGESNNVFIDNYKFMATPYYRMFFGKKTNGFFIEGNATLINANYFYTVYTSNSSWRVDNKEVSFGLGAALGLKFATKNNYIGEILGGAGRFLGDTYREVYPRIGITIGKRF